MPAKYSPLASARHLPDSLFHTAEHYPSRPAQWYRQDGEYLPVTYSQLASRVRHVASGLIRAGVKAGDRIAILMENRPEWAVADYAILSLGAVTVPLYCSYRPQDMAYVLKDAGVTAVFVSGGQLLVNLLKAVGNCPDIQAIYTLEETEGERLHHITELEAGDADMPALEARLAEIDRDQLATLVYTSGTTANPKGVMLSHGNFLANLEAVPDIIDFTAEDKMLSFLPLAHALERMAGHFLPYAFGLSVAFAERPDTVAKNLAETHPTLMISVPRMLEVVRSRILGQVAKQPALKQKLFHHFLALAGRAAKHGVGGLDALVLKLLDRLVGAKIRERFGSRIRLMVSGGAPLSTEVAEFFEAVGIPILEGYGLTESSPLISANPADDRRIGSVGKPVTGVRVRIAEDGEILARGGNIMLGYWHLDEATKEAVDDKGWLHTGDLGMVDEDGYLYITGRKKDLIVNSGGENIAPARIETLLDGDELIEQSVVYGDQKPYLVALIVPNQEACLAWAKEEGLPETDWEGLCTSAIFRKALQTKISQILKPLNPFEQVRRIHIISEPFTIEDGLLTPTLKIKRRKVYERYAEVLENLYN